jgi:hypothetical protein
MNDSILSNYEEKHHINQTEDDQSSAQDENSKCSSDLNQIVKLTVNGLDEFEKAECSE